MHGAIFGTNNLVAAALRNSILAEAMGEEVFVNAMEILYSSDDDNNSLSFDDDMEVEQEQQEIQRLQRSRRANNGDVQRRNVFGGSYICHLKRSRSSTTMRIDESRSIFGGCSGFHTMCIATDCWPLL
jgi:hypothetical protein